MSVKVVVPTIGESVTEADILAWKKSSGEYVQMDEAILELESDKATLDVNAPCGGILTITVAEGTVGVGDEVASIEECEAPLDNDVNNANTLTTEKKQEEVVPQAKKDKKILSPAAKKIVAEKNIDANSVTGTGKDGRITKQDISSIKLAPQEKQTSSVSQEVKQVVKGEREVKIEKMSRLRKIVASRLVEAQQTTAMLTTFNEIDMSAVINIRKQYKEQFKEKYGVNLGFMSFFSKAVTLALQDLPAVNAQIEGEEIKYHNYIDLGIAVSTPKGLVVPVVRNAESMSFSQIERSILDLALKGRDGKLTPEEMTGGTFTITNGGVFGSMLSTPILNRPQSGILGMHNIVERAVVVDGKIVIRPMMYVALSYDHRIIDGKEAVTFLVKIKQLIQDPTRILLGLEDPTKTLLGL